MKIEINPKNRKLAFIAAFTTIILAIGLTAAYTDPPGAAIVAATMGHSVDEMDWAQKIQATVNATGDFCTDQGGGVCLSTVAGGGGEDNDWEAVGGGNPTLAGNIYHTGNVGIGDITPDSKLDVDGGDIRISTAGKGLIFPDGTKQTTATVGVDLQGWSFADNYFYDDGEEVIRASDEWLRLNNAGQFTSGVFTPGKLRADGGLYVGDDEYFWRDAEDRISTNDDFYVHSASANTYLYSTNTYLGAGSGDTIHVRGNVMKGDLWYMESNGLRLGSKSSPGSWELYTDGQVYVSDYLRADGGIHVGGSSDPGTDNLIVDGKVGIGKTAPTQKLDVVGNIKATGTICGSAGCVGDGGGLSCTTRTVTGNGKIGVLVTASCIAGEVITGGGCRRDGSSIWFKAFYISGNSYRCESGTSQPVSVTAYARCCK